MGPSAEGTLRCSPKRSAQLLVPDETVVCELCVRYSRHEGISAVATAEALTRGKA